MTLTPDALLATPPPHTRGRYPPLFPLERTLAAFGLVILLRGVTFYPTRAGASVYGWREEFAWPFLLALGIFAYFFLALLPRWRHATAVARRLPLLWLFVAFVTLSVFWSIDRSLSVITLPIFFGATATGLYLTTVFSVEDQVKVIAGVGLIVALSSVLLVFFLPSLGILGQAWRGIFENPSAFARATTLGVSAFLLMALRGKRTRTVASVGVIVSAALVVLSGSATALIVTVAVAGLILLGWSVVRLDGRLSATALLGTLALTVIAVAGFTYVQRLMTWLGHSIDLAERGEMWPILVRATNGRAWLGYGFSAFWQGNGPPSGDAWAHLSFHPGHAHNGLLETMLGVGYVGLALFLLTLLVVFFKWLRNGAAGRSILAWWPPVVLLHFLLWNMTESQLLNWRHPALWGLLVMAVLTAIQKDNPQGHHERAMSLRTSKHVGSRGTPSQ